MTFDTSEDIRIYKREGKWFYTNADAYTTGPFSASDDEGPYDSLVECCVALAAKNIPNPFE